MSGTHSGEFNPWISRDSQLFVMHLTRWHDRLARPQSLPSCIFVIVQVLVVPVNRMSFLQAQKRCRKERQPHGCYVQIAGACAMQQGARPKTRDCDSGETSPATTQTVAEAPPPWFKSYMAQVCKAFKKFTLR